MPSIPNKMITNGKEQRDNITNSALKTGKHRGSKQRNHEKRPEVPSKTGKQQDQRGKKAELLISWLHEVQNDWLEEKITNSKEKKEETKPIPCNSYEDVVDHWKKAMKWRRDMDDVLSIMLAVAASTVQQGDQLFLMVIGSASGGKTQFCDGLTISQHCYQLEHLTGFFSGFKDSEGNDYSLIGRVNNTTMVTSEGDVLINSPSFNQVMSQGRRMFDGTATASYKNLKEDRVYSSLRLTWIIAGTPAMLAKEQASLGDRFLKVWLDSPPEEQKKQILQRVSKTAWNALMIDSVDEGAISTSDTTVARQKTAGYIDWLRENTAMLKDIECEDKYFEQCENLAFLVAILRGRPPKDEHTPPTLEEPNRLNHQFVRLMGCLCFVLNKRKVDKEVMRRVKKVALDTGHGVVLEIVKLLSELEEGITTKAISIYIDKKEDTVRYMLRFLRKVKVVELEGDDGKSKRTRKPMWKLTKKLENLCEEIFDL